MINFLLLKFIKDIIINLLLFINLVLISLLYGINFNNEYQIISLLQLILMPLFLRVIQFDKPVIESYFKPLKYYLFSWLIMFITIILILFLLKKSEEISRFVMVIWFASSFVIITASYYIINIILNKALRNYGNGIQIALMGKTTSISEYKSVLNDYLPMKVKSIDLFDGNSLEKLINNCREGLYQVIFIEIDDISVDKYNKIEEHLSDTSVSIYLLPSKKLLKLFSYLHYNIAGLNILDINYLPCSGFRLIVKRVFDICFSVIILLIITPLLFAITIIIKLTSKGPVLFIQERYGINGRIIKIYKFRSMHYDSGSDEKLDVVTDDPRVFKFGSFLRKTSLDELPQFLNVLQGRMSVVGPRPHAIKFNDYYRKVAPNYMRRHLMKPGITGWAQVNGWRGETDTNDKILKRTEFDLFYINNWSLIYDIKIITMTILGGFNKNAK